MNKVQGRKTDSDANPGTNSARDFNVDEDPEWFA